VAGHDAYGVGVSDIGAAWVVSEFLKEVFGGVAVGLVTGLVVSYLTSRIDDHLVEILLTTILAYGTYLLAEHLHVSGVIGVVVAGMMSGNYGTRFGMSPTVKIAVVTFWEYAAFVVNSIIFLLIGMEVQVNKLFSYSGHILVAWLCVVLARAVVVNALYPLLNKYFRSIPWKWSPVIVWGGLRGSLSMALALSLDRDLPFRETILSMTFGVVILSILGQGLSMKKLLGFLGMAARNDLSEYEEMRAGLKSAHLALEELESMYRERTICNDVYEKLRAEYQERINSIESRMNRFHQEQKISHQNEELAAREQLLAVEKSALQESFQTGSISEDVLKKLISEIDARLDKMSEKE